MLILSYLHQLFNTDTCNAYLHTLRWKERPLHCPQCQSHDVGHWGAYHYRPGLQRYWCHGCRRTFNDLTHTLLAQSKRALEHWILTTFLLCLSCSSRRIARELGIHISTSYRWCWWLRNAALSYEMERQVEGTVEADELYHTAGQKGQTHHGGKKALGRRARGRRKKREPGRGHDDKDRPAIIAWVSRQGAVVIQVTRDFTVATVQKQIPRSSRRNGLPMKRIDGTLLMRHKHLAGALVELREIAKTASGADGVLHHPPEAFDGIEVVATMGREKMEAKLVMRGDEEQLRRVSPWH